MNSRPLQAISVETATRPALGISHLEPQNPWIDEFNVVQEHCATDFKAPKLGKGSSGDRRFDFVERPTNNSIKTDLTQELIKSPQTRLVCILIMDCLNRESSAHRFMSTKAEEKT